MVSFVGQGISGKDVTTFIDSVSMDNAVPEPSSLASIITAALAMSRGRKRK
jgi:hypothetical protein